jgi:hypothetical protein
MALGDGFGKQGLQGAGAPSVVSVGASSTLVISGADTAKAEFISVINDSSLKIYLSIGAPAELGKCIPLGAGGGGVVFTRPISPDGLAIYAISTGAANLCLQVAS